MGCVRSSVIAVLSLLLLACGSGSVFADQVDDPFSGGYPTFHDRQSGYRVVFGTPDLGIGTSRVAFALFSGDGLVQSPSLRAATYRPDGGSLGDPVEAKAVTYYPFPLGARGIYAGEFTFDRAGRWALSVEIPRPGEAAARLAFPFEVAETTSAPVVGDLAPPSASRTLADVSALEELSTGSEPDPRLYARSIASALDAGRPFVVVFASPAYCTNALCGPQVEMLSQLADAFGDGAEFIHVDLYENPHEIQGDLSRARRSPVLAEWGLHTDEWTFVVDADGRVAARFEAFVPRAELEAALLRTLKQAGR